MRMKHDKYMKIILFLIIISTLLLAGCSGLFGDKRSACAADESCRYYTGSRGIVMYPEASTRTLYYRPSDIGTLDGNMAEFNVRLINDGASDSYGAIFISGFAPELFALYKYENGMRERIFVERGSVNNCFFDLLGFGNTLSFVAGCQGMILSQSGMGNWRLSLDFERLGSLLGRNFPPITVNLQDLGNNNWNIGLGYDGIGVNIFKHGAILMAMVMNMNFDQFGGSTFVMKGDNADSPGGDYDYKTFAVQLISSWPAGQDYFRVPYQIKSCYAYTTFVSPMVCIDPDPFSAEPKVCHAESMSWGGTQGAPVAVTRMTQMNTGREMILEFTIKNVGPGTVWDVGYLESCSPYFPGAVKPNMHNVVYIGQAWMGDIPVDCTNTYKIRLDPRTQQAQFTCRYNLYESGNVGSAYTIPLKMELWYGYEENYNNQITVRRFG